MIDIKNVKFEELKNEGLEREFKVTVKAEELTKLKEAKLAQIQKTAKFDGFRAGKVPMQVVERKYGEQLAGEIIDQAVQSSSEGLFTKEKLRPTSQPKIEVITFELGKDLEYKVEIEIFPEVKELSLKGIKVEKPVIKVEDKEVEETISNMLKGRGTKEVTDRKEAKNGDIVDIDFKGSIEGEYFAGGEAQGNKLELGTNSFIGDFEKQIEGKKIGEEFDVNVSFPEEYHSKELAGKPAKFECKLNSIHEKSDAELDDAFAQQNGFESAVKVREYVKDTLARSNDNVARSIVKKDLFDKLSDSCKVELPKSMIELEKDAISKQLVANKEADENQADVPDIKKIEELAERRVKLGIILSDYSINNNIKVSNEELEEAIKREAAMYPGQAEQVYNYYKQNVQAIEQLKGPILEEKAVDQILEKIEVVEKEMSSDEVKKILDTIAA